MSELSSVTSIETLYADGRSRKNLDSVFISSTQLSFSKNLSNVPSLNQSINQSSTKVKSKPTRLRRVPFAKTTRTCEMRRKAGEEKAKEWAIEAFKIKKARELRQTPKPPVKPVTEREKQTSVKASTAAYSASRKSGGSNLNQPITSNAMKRLHNILYPAEKTTPRMKSVEVQTCKSEVVNNMLLIGDSKVLRPSPTVWSEILRKREENMKLALLKETRKVPEHSVDEVNYQSNLKEFLETGTVRRYGRDTAEIKQSGVRNDVFRRPHKKSRSPPEMDLKKRISQIEEELMGVFNGRT